MLINNAYSLTVLRIPKNLLFKRLATDYDRVSTPGLGLSKVRIQHKFNRWAMGILWLAMQINPQDKKAGGILRKERALRLR